MAHSTASYQVKSVVFSREPDYLNTERHRECHQSRTFRRSTPSSQSKEGDGKETIANCPRLQPEAEMPTGLLIRIRPETHCQTSCRVPQLVLDLSPKSWSKSRETRCKIVLAMSRSFGIAVSGSFLRARNRTGLPGLLWLQCQYRSAPMAWSLEREDATVQLTSPKRQLRLLPLISQSSIHGQAKHRTEAQAPRLYA